MVLARVLLSHGGVGGRHKAMVLVCLAFGRCTFRPSVGLNAFWLCQVRGGRVVGDPPAQDFRNTPSPSRKNLAQAGSISQRSGILSRQACLSGLEPVTFPADCHSARMTHLGVLHLKQ